MHFISCVEIIQPCLPRFTSQLAQQLATKYSILCGLHSVVLVCCGMHEIICHKTSFRVGKAFCGSLKYRPRHLTGHRLQAVSKEKRENTILLQDLRLREEHIRVVTMVNLLRVKPVEVVGGIVDRPPCAGNEKAVESFRLIPCPLPWSAAEEFWSDFVIVCTKPLLAEDKHE